MDAASGGSGSAVDERNVGARWYNAVWRWHFYAGLFCIPFVIWLALTGTIYLWRPQLEAWLDRPYDRLPVGGATFAPDAQVGAALRAVPGSSLRKYVLPQQSGHAVRVIVTAGRVDERVYINPRSLTVLNVVREDDRLFNVVSRLHGQLLAGKWGSYLVEIAACWAVVMLLTGLYLWWPRNRRGLAGVLYPRLRGGRRRFWRDVHATAGIWVSVFALGLILTGLPWASAWGSYMGEVRALTGTVAGPVDWTIGGKAPAPGRDAMPGLHAHHEGMAVPAPPVKAGELARVIATVRPLQIAPPVLLSPPKHQGGPWAVASDAADRPLRSEAEVDGSTGRLVGRVAFADRHVIDRIVGYGIAVHEGALFGIANQLIGTLTALLLIVLAVSGAIMWWRRRPIGLLGAPLPLARPRFRTGLVAAIVALGAYMPLFGATLILAVVGERAVLRRIPTTRHWLGLS
ncbi:PepSY-associated TM helix domain-containing protein [Sphingomonas sp. TX0543]|uniref:PepSY-associated TM helix domain-containing protein n=1 Tax=unclassified Sphingomonas TaxID=196159 RepID=UPI0010F65E40|nr:PepSY domain-containing protein [Sphingomonas sp. 3P27F8]